VTLKQNTVEMKAGLGSIDKNPWNFDLYYVLLMAQCVSYDCSVNTIVLFSSHFSNGIYV
jgi:hypothetical protein